MATASTPASTPAEKAAATRKKNAVKRSTTAKKAAATRRQTTAAKQAAEAKSEVKGTVKRAGVMAEKAVLVPVGAALIARDGVVTTFEDLRSNYSTRRKTEQEFRRFERRGTTAVKTVERELRSMMKSIETRTEPVTKNVDVVTARVENAVAGGRNAAAKVQERITALV